MGHFGNEVLFSSHPESDNISVCSLNVVSVPLLNDCLQEQLASPSQKQGKALLTTLKIAQF